jgi:hypothetical protein
MAASPHRRDEGSDRGWHVPLPDLAQEREARPAMEALRPRTLRENALENLLQSRPEASRLTRARPGE